MPFSFNPLKNGEKLGKSLGIIFSVWWKMKHIVTTDQSLIARYFANRVSRQARSAK
jgi:hypothetical protein